MMNIVLYLLLGIVAGSLSGLIGIGGGILVVPMLVMLFKFSQQSAQGTSLAMMIPPIGILAVLTYYKNGFVDLKAAGLLCAGFVLGGLLGAKLAVSLPTDILKRVFGLILLLVALRMIFSK